MDAQLIQLNLAAPLSPPLDAFQGHALIKPAGVGSIIVTSFRVVPFLPIRAHWISRITEFEWNHHFTDVQDKGPFKTWCHRHEFARETRDGVDGTVVGDAVDYDVGFGFVGNLANRFFVARQMLGTFQQRQQALPRLLKTSDL